MVYNGYCPLSFICVNIISIPKGSKANLSDSDKYMSIAISSLLGQILDHIIIEKQSKEMKTCNLDSKQNLQPFFIAPYGK